MSDLAQHFHLPINAAAKELGICPTVLKKICRRNGMRRWPHRKVGHLLHETQCCVWIARSTKANDVRRWAPCRCHPLLRLGPTRALASRHQQCACSWQTDQKYRAHHRDVGADHCRRSRPRRRRDPHGDCDAEK